MIKLKRPPKPSKLTDEFVEKQTLKYKKDKTSVWKIKAIENALLDMTHNKCAYCESPFYSSYMEVEHIKPKSKYPDLVLDWENLLPSCNKCNCGKSKKDDEIINPCEIEPKLHILYDNEMYRFIIHSSSDIGKNTINFLKLNDNFRIEARKNIFSAFNSCQIKLIKQSFEKYQEKSTDNNLDNLIKDIESALMLCQPNMHYSAIYATMLHSNDEYKTIFQYLKEHNLLIDELNQLHEISLNSSLHFYG